MVKKFRVTIFRELNFRFRGHPRTFFTGFIEKIYCARWTRALCVRGYHVYREIWEAAVGQYVRESHGTRRTGTLWRYKTVASLTARTLALYLLYIVRLSPPFLLASGFLNGTVRFSYRLRWYYQGKSTSRVGKTVLRLQVSQTEEPSRVKQQASCAT